MFALTKLKSDVNKLAGDKQCQKYSNSIFQTFCLFLVCEITNYLMRSR